LDGRFNIAANATEGNHSVKVKLEGHESNSVNFYVQYPRKLVRQEFPEEYQAHVMQESTGISTLMTLTDGSLIGFDGNVMTAGGQQLTHRCGAYRLLLYQLADAEGMAIQPGANIKVTVNETFPTNEHTGDSSGSLLSGSGEANDLGYVVDLNGILTPAGHCRAQAYNETMKQHFSVTVGNGTTPFDLSTVVKIEFHFDPMANSYTISNTITTQ
jgi:hypothetical protein